MSNTTQGSMISVQMASFNIPAVDLNIAFNVHRSSMKITLTPDTDKLSTCLISVFAQIVNLVGKSALLLTGYIPASGIDLSDSDEARNKPQRWRNDGPAQEDLCKLLPIDTLQIPVRVRTSISSK